MEIYRPRIVGSLLIAVFVLLSLCCRHSSAEKEQTVYVRLGESVVLTCPVGEGQKWDRITWESEDGRFLGVGNHYNLAQVTADNAGVYRCRKQRFFRDPTAKGPNVDVVVTRLVVQAEEKTSARPNVEEPTELPQVATTQEAKVDDAPSLPVEMDVSASCLANQIACGISNTSKPPTKRCILKAWLCDGEDDCYNGWDEENCSKKKMCRERLYKCENSKQIIPMGYRCDHEIDCVGGDDEKDCAAPVFVSPSGLHHIYKIQADTKSKRPVRMKCTAQGLPSPTIIWRQNGHRVTAKHQLEESCQKMPNGTMMIHSTLIVVPARSSDAGFYTCEANSGSGRTFSPDFLLRVV